MITYYIPLIKKQARIKRYTSNCKYNYNRNLRDSSDCRFIEALNILVWPFLVDMSNYVKWCTKCLYKFV